MIAAFCSISRRLSWSSRLYLRIPGYGQLHSGLSNLRTSQTQKLWWAQNRTTSLWPVRTSGLRMNEATGLFDNPQLCTPDGFDVATQQALQGSAKLVQQISEMANKPSVEVIEKMDELSDVLCRVADLAECIRQVHPDAKFVQKAQEACILINNYVEELNTSTDLHRALRNLMYESDEFAKLDKVTQRTAESFMHDFEISGIHLGEAAREEVVKLNSQILELSHKFLENTTIPVQIPVKQCPPFLTQAFSSNSKHVLIDHIPFTDPDSKLRALSYILYYSTIPQQREVLELLLSARHKLATLVGYKTFSHRVLKSTMAENPQTVAEFLEKLSERILPLAKEEVAKMKSLKLEVGDQVNADIIQPWDAAYLTSVASRRCVADLKGAKEWFSFDACISGLQNLFQKLFAVKLVPVTLKKGEAWNDLVQKFAFVDEKEGILGYTYCDLHARPGKVVSDCHFTIQGARELPDGSYQLPIITLCCNIQPGSPTLLSQQSVENLFHEMGHALHSMFGRPKYQNVTGTRCSTDFAEVPSILMEYFLTDSRVLESFAVHYITKAPLPKTLMEGFQLSRSIFPAFDTQMQIMYAIMDQRFHGEHPLGKSTVELFADLHSQYAPIEYVPQTAFFLRFNHLYGYAAKYYSYLWSRAVASLIWNSCFKDDPFSPEMGQKYRKMLTYGGGIHPRTLIRDMLGFEPTISDLVDALHSDVVQHRDKISIF